MTFTGETVSNESWQACACVSSICIGTLSIGGTGVSGPLLTRKSRTLVNVGTNGAIPSVT